MKKKASLILLATLALALLLAGCNTGADSSLPASSTPQEPAVSPLEQSIAEYEGLVAADPSAENYLALAGYYQQAGRVKKQRDALESCYRLHRDDASLQALQDVVVNIAEESEAVREEARLLEQNLSIAEYQAEAAGMLLNPDWHATMMPKLKTGRRTYYLDGTDGQSSVVIEVGYSEDGAPYSRAWRVAGEAQEATCLLQEGSAIQLLATTMADGQYNGPFDSWLCVGETGTVYHDTGTFTNGVMTGAYTSDVSSMGGEADPFALFSTRTELEPETYTGDFGENGATTLPQPEGETGFVAYAYNSDKTNYLLLNTPADTDPAAHVFDYGFLGLSAYPAYTPYTPVPDPAPTGEVTVDLAQVQVRVNDGNVEWFDGATWHVMGNVAELAQQDPFLAAEQAAEQAAAAQAPDGGAEEDNLSEIRDPAPDSSSHPSPFAGRGTAQAASASSSSGASSSGASSQAAGSKPASSAAQTTPQSQAPAPAPTQAPAPAPTQAPAPAPTQAPAPTEAPPPVQPEGTGNDGEDINWSNDIL